MRELTELFWIFLPAGAANISPSLAAKFLPRLSFPLDFGNTFRGKRIFGENKTIRGVVAGVLGGGAVFFLQGGNLPWYVGFLMGFGAVGGDALESFIKRQLGKEPGRAWIPFDQIDWVCGAIIFSWPFVSLSWGEVLYLCGAGGVAHILVKLGGYALHIEKTPL